MRALAEAIREMPTLHSGHFDNMKIESERFRVWHSRVTDEITVEECTEGRWEVKEVFK